MKQLKDLPLLFKQEKDRNKEEGIYSIKHPWVKTDYIIVEVRLTDETEIVSVRIVQPVSVSKAKGRNRFPTVQELMAVRNLFFTTEETVWTPIPVDREQYFSELVCARVNKVQQAIAEMNKEESQEFVPE